jgi:hypothetical protein
MGDMADFALDQMSDLDDLHYSGEIDEETGMIYPSPFTSQPSCRRLKQIKRVTCRNCGKEGLRWKEHKKLGFRLYEGHIMHECDKCVICKHCGKEGLRWKKLEQLGYRLFDGETIHHCEEYRREDQT